MRTRPYRNCGSLGLIARGLVLALAAAIIGRPVRAQDSTASRAAGPDNAITARAIASPPPTDARVEAGVWSRADSITTLRQRDPNEGASATERTVVKVLHDHDALYVAVRAWDREAGRIRATQLRRDADLSADDNVTILIDSFHDRSEEHTSELQSPVHLVC